MKNYSASIAELATQYKDSSNLSARQRIYRFAKPSGNPPWPVWVFDQLELPGDARILEMGCGNAALWKANLGRIPAGWRVTLSDSFAGMLADARRSLGTDAKRFAFERFDAQAIPHAEGAFDAVIANHMLYHVPDPGRAIGEVHRVLRPGGKFYAATNGNSHLGALRELVDCTAPGPWEGFDGSFRLENGEEQLRAFFCDVQLRRIVRELAITVAGAIVDYALSIEWVKPVLVGRKLEEFRELVEGLIVSQGAFRVATEAGLFIATR